MYPISPHEPLQVGHVFEAIYATLARPDGLPTGCVKCGKRCDTVRAVRVEHEDFLVQVPLRVCSHCQSRPPFPPSSIWARHQATIILGILVIAVVTALMQLGHDDLAFWTLAAFGVVTLLWSNSRPQRAPSRELRSLFEKVPEYRMLAVVAPDLQVKPDPDAEIHQFVEARRHTLFPRSSEANRFAESIVNRQNVTLLMDEEELRQSRIPVPIFNAYTRIVRQKAEQALNEVAGQSQAHLRIAFVLLPDHTIQFDVEVPRGSHFRDRLKRRTIELLSDIPGWPVDFPVVFAIASITDATKPLPDTSSLNRLFDKWLAQRPRPRAQTYAQLALELFDVALPDKPSGFELEDVRNLARILPRDLALQMMHAGVLQAGGRHEEALKIYEQLEQEHPDQPCTIYHRILALWELGQHERAAALCQQCIESTPEEIWPWALLARLQLAMDRPEESLQTLATAMDRSNWAELSLIRAEAHLAKEDFDQAHSDLTLAIFRNHDFGEAYGRRAQLRFHLEKFDDALADVTELERCLGQSIQSVELRAAILKQLNRTAEAEAAYRDAIVHAPESVVLKLQFARFLASSGKLATAREECSSIITQQADCGQAYALRAAIALDMHDAEAAIHDANTALEHHSDDVRVLLVRGLARAELGEIESGLEDLDRCVERAPEDPVVRMHRGRLLARSQELVSAIGEFSAALDAVPDWADARVERGYVYIGLEEADSAAEDFQYVIDREPARGDAYTGRAITHLMNGDRTEATEDLNKAVMLDPADTCGRLNRALLLLKRQEIDLAREDLNEVLAAAPDTTLALFHRAHLHLHSGDFAAARKDFDRLIEMNPDQPHSYIGRSVASENIGDTDQAEADFSNAQELDPFSTAELALSRTLLSANIANQRDEFDKAIELATQLIEEHPDPPLDAYRLRGHAYWYTEQFVEALDDYSHVIGSGDDLTRYDYSACGQVLSELGEFEQALEYLDRSIEIAREDEASPGLAYSLSGRGRALAGLGRFEEAEREFGESLTLKPDNAWLHFNRGLMYIEQDETAKALACFELSLEVDSPKLPPGKRRRASVFVERMRSKDSETTD